MSNKFGLNAYRVYVQEKYCYAEPTIRCAWLGHSRFKCGNCKLGYFHVHSDCKHDEECPECKYRVVIRWAGTD